MNSGSDTSAERWLAWQSACQEMGVALSDAQRETFERFYAQLLEANQTVNLTRITALDDFLNRHLLDSLSIAPLLPNEAAVADVGSGAGFPAIPLAIARPDLRMTAIESVGKKCRFIQSVQESLQLSNLSVISERSETLAQRPEFRERFDVVTSRAVAALPVLLELCLPLVEPGGLFLAMKGLSYEAELEASKKALHLLGGRLREVVTFDRPELSASRLIVVEKPVKTPSSYPRNSGTITKSPL